MSELLPQVLVVGPSGVGKSEFCRHFTTVFPQYATADDTVVIEEFLRLDRLVAERPPDLVAQLQALRVDSLHCTDLIDAHLGDLAAQRVPTPRCCTPLGPEWQLSPPAWDEALVRLGRSLPPPGPYLVQIARGHDPAYLAQFGLTEDQVYPRALRLFLDALDPRLRRHVALVHLSASYKARAQRNEHRAKTTGQHVPQGVMESVFARDVFGTERVPHFIWVGGYRIPVVPIRNDRTYDEAQRAVKMGALAARAMEFFLRGLSAGEE